MRENGIVTSPDKHQFASGLQGMESLRFLHDGARRRCRQADVGRDKLEQVVGRRVQTAGGWEKRKMHPSHRSAGNGMPDGQSRLQFRCQGNSRTVHPQWPADPLDHQCLVIFAGFQGNDMAEQLHSKIGIFLLNSRGAGQRVMGQKSIQLFDRIVRLLRIPPTFGRLIIGSARQAGGMSGKVE